MRYIYEGSHVALLGKICLAEELRDNMLGVVRTVSKSLLIAIMPVYWRVHRSVCKWRTHLEQICLNYPPACDVRDMMIGGVHCMPPHYACHWFVIPAVAILEGAQVRMQTMSALGTNFSKLTTSLQHDAWRHTNILAGASILCMPLFCDTSLLVTVQTRNALGTIFL